MREKTLLFYDVLPTGWLPAGAGGRNSRCPRRFGGAESGLRAGECVFGVADCVFGPAERGFALAEYGFGRAGYGFGGEECVFALAASGFSAVEYGFGVAEYGFAFAECGFGVRNAVSGCGMRFRGAECGFGVRNAVLPGGKPKSEFSVHCRRKPAGLRRRMERFHSISLPYLMDQFKEDQLVMCGRVVTYVTEKAGALAASPVAAAQAADVTTMYKKVDGARGGTAKRTKKLTDTAKTARKQLLDLLPGLLGPLGRVAVRLGDTDLQAAVTLGGRQLRKLRPLAFIGVVGSVLTSAARADVVPELAKQGLTTKALKPLADALENFRTAQPAPAQIH